MHLPADGRIPLMLCLANAAASLMSGVLYLLDRRGATSARPRRATSV